MSKVLAIELGEMRHVFPRLAWVFAPAGESRLAPTDSLPIEPDPTTRRLGQQGPSPRTEAERFAAKTRMKDLPRGVLHDCWAGGQGRRTPLRSAHLPEALGTVATSGLLRPGDALARSQGVIPPPPWARLRPDMARGAHPPEDMRQRCRPRSWRREGTQAPSASHHWAAGPIRSLAPAG
jgi:hypothetical protein